MRLLADENMVGLDSLPGEIEVVQILGRAIDAAAVRDFDALWVRSVTRVDEALVDGSRLRFVGTATAGLEHVDVDHLARRGIAFAAAPGANAMAVVEYVIAALLAAEEPWERLCAGGSLGIVGFGQVGRRLAALARVMGWTVRISDPWVAAQHSGTAEDACTGAFADLEDVLACDVISLHSALHDRQPWPSRHLIDSGVLDTLGSSQWLVNACRGAVVDNDAVLSSLEEDRGPQLILDVWEGEPDIRWRLLESPRVHIATPHIAGYSWDAKGEAVRLLLNATHAAGLVGSKTMTLHAPAPVLPNASWPRVTTPAALVHEVYDPRNDDRGLRALLQTPSAQRGAGFDRLRRDYPLRREVSALLAERGLGAGTLEEAESLDGDAGRVGRLVAGLSAAREFKG